MEARRKGKTFFGHTVNSLTRQNKYFHWLITYSWYSNLTPKQKIANKIWKIGIAMVGCMSEAFDFKELVFWCTSRFNSNHRITQVVVERRNPILLTSKVFKKLL
jgi:hypothetical protein